jgi:hypothetical protein
MTACLKSHTPNAHLEEEKENIFEDEEKSNYIERENRIFAVLKRMTTMMMAMTAVMMTAAISMTRGKHAM